MNLTLSGALDCSMDCGQDHTLPCTHHTKAPSDHHQRQETHSYPNHRQMPLTNCANTLSWHIGPTHMTVYSLQTTASAWIG